MSRKKLMLFVAMFCILIIVIVTWQFSFVLRNVFINQSGFISKDNKVYFSPLLPTSLQDSLSTLVQKAEQRNIAFWGINDHKYKIIFCANNNEVGRYSGNDQFHTVSRRTLLLGTFTVIGREGFNVDVISHELCHSYFWSQLSYFDKRKIPTWFDEGLASQLDYRSFLNDSALEKTYITNYDNLRNIETPEQFYKGGWPLMKKNYIIARIEIKQFLNSCGIEGIKQIIENLNKGDNFVASYKKIKETCHGASRLLGEGN
ncbi:hypothetical protein [Paludibacter jiangxiensis]|uniref:Peptidase MA superfamily protein n=1 Tax=Paludibacter jiangxiensis TaxID=681398 RepID=A0A170YZB6_9BACT|nr:hypothetical protein [Paludibacter jiangxiensis]GAT62198.1 hypothetical protein PJIAN_1791 [Paludibacter jiangxiensis]